jgi:hypothetical protein
MSSSSLRTIIAILLFIHAIGHIQGAIVASGILATERWNAQSWLLDGILGERGARTLALLLWSATVVGFFATAFAFVGVAVPHEWWRTLAIIFALISFPTLVLYWHSFVLFFPNKIGALGVDLAILIGLFFMKWPAESDLGL